MRTRMESGMALFAGLTLLAAGHPAARLEAQDQAAWRYRSPAELRMFRVAATGAVLAASDSGVLALAPEDGRTIWSRPDATAYRPLGNTGSVLLFGPGLVEVADVETGASRWSLRSLPIDWRLDLQVVPERGLLLVFAGRSAGFSLIGVSLDSGTVRWSADTLFANVPDLARKAGDIELAGHQPLLLDSDTTLVMFPTRGGPMRLDTRSGALLWRADTLAREEPRRAALGYAPMVADSGLVLVPYDRKLMAIRAADGTVAWDHRENFHGHLAEIVPTPRGRRGRGYPRHGRPTEYIRAFVDLLDPATGRSRWPKPAKGLDDATAMLVRGDTVYVGSARKLFRFDLATGAAGPEARYQFWGGESPCCIEERDGDLVLLSSQNLVRLAPDGTPRYERYYGAPGASLLAKIASTALLVGISAAGDQALRAQGFRPLTPMTTSNPVLERRYRATVFAERYVHMLTGKKDASGREGFSVVRLEKESGAEAGRVWVDDRSPTYALDPASGTVYLQRDEYSLEALRFH